ETTVGMTRPPKPTSEFFAARCSNSPTGIGAAARRRSRCNAGHDADLNRSKTPALAKVTIYEIAERSGGWLTTSAQADDREDVGSAEWRRGQQCNAGSS